jgi:catechol 2,3-dioxygenase-like lactoylglutathione lyase family enzyme
MNRIYSCDDHLDLSAVPPDLWEARVARADAERAPRAVPGDRGTMWVCEDRVMGRSGMPANRAVLPRPRLRHRRREASSVYVRDPDGNLLEFMISA